MSCKRGTNSSKFKNKLSMICICFYLKILQAKIRRLEHLLHLKDIRVDDLAERLDRTRGLPGAGGAVSNRQQPQTHMPFNGRK